MEYKESEKRLVGDYGFFGMGSLLYAIFYTICLYQNTSGVTFPIFTAGTLYFFYCCTKRLGLQLKKDSIFYMVSIELFGLSTFLTGDYRIIALNKLAIFILLIAFVLHTTYEDKNWSFGKYISSMAMTIILPLGFIDRPIKHCFSYLQNRRNANEDGKEDGKFKYIILGTIIGLPMVFIITLLLIGADAVFADIFERIFSEDIFTDIFSHGFKIFMLTVVIFFISYMVLCFINNKEIKEESGEQRKGEPLIAITIASILSVVYFVFSGIQFIYLFIGGIVGNLSLPNNMTYSEYARQGFFYLLFVCILNLVIVLMGIYLFKENKTLKILLCFITACTYVMIASSALRMILYIQYQYLTFLRIFVLWALLVIFLLMTGVIISICKPEFRLFHYSVVVVTVLYLIFSFSRPDYFIAKVNTDNMSTETQYTFFKGSPLYDDYCFLIYELGPDAAPILMTDEAVTLWRKKSQLDNQKIDWTIASENWRYDYIDEMYWQTEEMGIRKFNLSRGIVRYLLEKE